MNDIYMIIKNETAKNFKVKIDQDDANNTFEKNVLKGHTACMWETPPIDENGTVLNIFATENKPLFYEKYSELIKEGYHNESVIFYENTTFFPEEYEHEKRKECVAIIKELKQLRNKSI